MFSGRKLYIATQHGKEKVIAPILEKPLGVEVVVANEIDTDQLGTFSGEIERTLTPFESALAKCRLAIEYHGSDLAIANEGSFGPHPSLYFIPADEELVVFVDKKNDLTIFSREISTETNFHGTEIPDTVAISNFAEKVKFPSHGIILRPSKNHHHSMIKGITDYPTLQEAADRLWKQFGQLYAETDMRAMYNPSRLKVIAKATESLLEKIKSLCPACGCPGYAISNALQGLPCRLCEHPTKQILTLIYTCQKCGHQQYKEKSEGEKYADPMYCDHCNP